MRQNQLSFLNISSKELLSNTIWKAVSVMFALLVLFSQNSFSQEVKKDSVKRPKIGLVLSGGGAKGFAHIGVLKVL